MKQMIYTKRLSDLIDSCIRGTLIKHERNVNDSNDVLTTLNKIFYNLPTTTIYITNEIEVISNYGILRDLASIVIEDHNIKFDLDSCLFTYNNGIKIVDIYNNRKLFNVVRTDKFNDLEIDKLRDCHHQLQTYLVPVIEIHSSVLDKYLMWR